MDNLVRIRTEAIFTAAFGVRVIRGSLAVGGKGNFASQGPSHIFRAGVDVIQSASPELYSLLFSDVLNDGRRVANAVEMIL